MGAKKIFLFIAIFPSKLRNYVYNRIFSALIGVRFRIIWAEARIIGVENIIFNGKFTAGRGMWLESIGGGRINIGCNVDLSDWVHIGCINEVNIGNGCLFGSKVLITDHNHGDALDILINTPLPPRLRELKTKGPVTLEKNVWLGDGVIVLPGVRIGQNSIIAANSVVTRDVPPCSIWGGIPAASILR